MAKIYPQLSAGQLELIESDAEKKVYKAICEQITNNFLFFFQASWILKTNRKTYDGEVDFLILDPQRGFLCLEVKGGGISLNASSQQWNSKDRTGKTHSIKDPFEQSKRAKYSIIEKLREFSVSDSLNIDLKKLIGGHAVFFPDISDKNDLQGADRSKEIIGSQTDLKDIEEWIEGALNFWCSERLNSFEQPSLAIDLFTNLFAKTTEVKSLLSAQLNDEKEQRLKLTNDQIKVLDFIQGQRRVAVSGGAGTGKTVLALEKAKRLTKQGFKTLFTCYNRPLAEKIKDSCRTIEGLEVFGYHELCNVYVNYANQQTGRDLLVEARETYPSSDEWRVIWPTAFAYAVEEIPKRFDAIICDEGQDFDEEWWLPLELLLDDYEQSPFYIFFDPNQNIYDKSHTLPIKQAPYTLTTNCRNTSKIHDLVYKFYKGPKVNAPSVIGREIEYIHHHSLKKQILKIHNRVLDLLTNDKLVPENIVILHAEQTQTEFLFENLSSESLPKNYQYLFQGIADHKSVLVDSVHRFKGLEAEVVFILGLDSVQQKCTELKYTALSRANSHLIVVCSSEEFRVRL